MRKNNCLRAAALLLACCMFGLCTITGTLAKFVKPFNDLGGVMARAGIFKVLVRASEDDPWQEFPPTPPEEIAIAMYDVLYEAILPLPLGTLENAGGEIHVDWDATNKIIAPGTGGKISIMVLNLSEVAVEAKLSFDTDEIAAGGPNIVLQATGTDVETIDTVTTDPSGKIAPISGQHLFDPIEWYWEFEDADDDLDTSLGTDGNYNYTIPLKIEVVQMD